MSNNESPLGSSGVKMDDRGTIFLPLLVERAAPVRFAFSTLKKVPFFLSLARNSSGGSEPMRTYSIIILPNR
jgi:hypothetical protein